MTTELDLIKSLNNSVDDLQRNIGKLIEIVELLTAKVLKLEKDKVRESFNNADNITMNAKLEIAGEQVGVSNGN